MNKITPKQKSALEYADSRNNYFPTYAVAKRLEAKGLIFWNGCHHSDYVGRNDNTQSSRGWRITEEGKKILDTL